MRSKPATVDAGHRGFCGSLPTSAHPPATLVDQLMCPAVAGRRRQKLAVNAGSQWLQGADPSSINESPVHEAALLALMQTPQSRHCLSARSARQHLALKVPGPAWDPALRSLSHRRPDAATGWSSSPSCQGCGRSHTDWKESATPQAPSGWLRRTRATRVGL